jgi:hypothetical protein
VDHHTAEYARSRVISQTKLATMAMAVQTINANVISQLSTTPAVADVAADADTRLRAALNTLTATAPGS